MQSYLHLCGSRLNVFHDLAIIMNPAEMSLRKILSPSLILLPVVTFELN